MPNRQQRNGSHRQQFDPLSSLRGNVNYNSRYRDCMVNNRYIHSHNGTGGMSSVCGIRQIRTSLFTEPLPSPHYLTDAIRGQPLPLDHWERREELPERNPAGDPLYCLENLASGSEHEEKRGEKEEDENIYPKNPVTSEKAYPKNLVIKGEDAYAKKPLTKEDSPKKPLTKDDSKTPITKEKDYPKSPGAIGCAFVSFVQGYYCKACRRYFNDDTKYNHCRSNKHVETFHKILDEALGKSERQKQSEQQDKQVRETAEPATEITARIEKETVVKAYPKNPVTKEDYPKSPEAIGCAFVSFIQGYYCKACRWYFNDDITNHCRSNKHVETFHKILDEALGKRERQKQSEQQDKQARETAEPATEITAVECSGEEIEKETASKMAGVGKDQEDATRYISTDGGTAESADDGTAESADDGTAESADGVTAESADGVTAESSDGETAEIRFVINVVKSSENLVKAVLGSMRARVSLTAFKNICNIL